MLASITTSGVSLFLKLSCKSRFQRQIHLTCRMVELFPGFGGICIILVHLLVELAQLLTVVKMLFISVVYVCLLLSKIERAKTRSLTNPWLVLQDGMACTTLSMNTQENAWWDIEMDRLTEWFIYYSFICLLMSCHWFIFLTFNNVYIRFIYRYYCSRYKNIYICIYLIIFI